MKQQPAAKPNGGHRRRSPHIHTLPNWAAVRTSFSTASRTEQLFLRLTQSGLPQQHCRDERDERDEGREPFSGRASSFSMSANMGILDKMMV